MAIVTINDEYLYAIGDSIRGKNGEDTQYLPSEMAKKIDEFVLNKGYNLIVIVDTGSIVKCVNLETSEEVTVQEIGGVWYFNLDAGEWEIICTLNEDTISSFEEIVDGESIKIAMLSYQLYASDFDWSGMGVLGVDYKIVTDNDADIIQEQWSTTKNWKCRALTSGIVIPLKNGYIDVFCVGGGASGNGAYANSSINAGNGGGYTNTLRNFKVISGAEYPIIVGAGGDGVTFNKIGNVGGETSAFSNKAAGGQVSTNIGTSGNGGSGGSSNSAGRGGIDGSDGLGTNKGYGQISVPGPNGETGNTREFGEENGTVYSEGGGSKYNTVMTPNSGNGGNAAEYAQINSTSGSDGIVVFRNARGAE